MNARSIAIASSLFFAATAPACGDASRRGFESDLDVVPNGEFGGGDAGKLHECAVNNISSDLERDFDGDGYALKDDCNECDPSINRGAYDIPGNGIDEDCNGRPDDEQFECDSNLSQNGSDPFDGARAIGLCRKAARNGREWGVVEASWVMPDGKLLGNFQGIGILQKFGVNPPLRGGSMLVLSSGIAAENAPTHAEKGYIHGTPAGYPKESPACPGVKTGAAQDGVGLELRIRVPSNAKSLSYQQNFFTHEYPSFICTEFNDFFVAILDPPPAGLPDGNIAFDPAGNPISVNNSFLQVCMASTQKGKQFDCPLGDSALSGTGYEGRAATGWLTTSTPVTPGSEVTLRFAIWDSSDGGWDSTVLIDDFEFSIEGADAARTKPRDPK